MMAAMRLARLSPSKARRPVTISWSMAVHPATKQTDQSDFGRWAHVEHAAFLEAAARLPAALDLPQEIAP